MILIASIAWVDPQPLALVRTIHYFSQAAQIDLIEKDRVTRSAAALPKGIQVTQSVLFLENDVDDVAVPSEKDLKALKWKWRVPSDSASADAPAFDDSLSASLDRIELVLSRWLDPEHRSAVSFDRTFNTHHPGWFPAEVNARKESATGQTFKIAIDYRALRGRRTEISGWALMDSRDGSLLKMNLRGKNVLMPGGDDVVSVTIDEVPEHRSSR